MSPKFVYITKADRTEHGRWPIDNPHIVRAAELEAELHNRDNPDDVWTVGIEEDEE